MAFSSWQFGIFVAVAFTAYYLPPFTNFQVQEVSADWREVARIVLHIDPEAEADRARRAFDGHLARAKWIARTGYRQLLRRGSLR